jgi:hypothetical protein
MCITKYMLLPFLIQDRVKYLLSLYPTLEEDHHLQFMYNSIASSSEFPQRLTLTAFTTLCGFRVVGLESRYLFGGF